MNRETPRLSTQTESEPSHAQAVDPGKRLPADMPAGLQSQSELERENAELRRTQQVLGESLDHYVHLYEFAPVAYLTLNSQGRIVEINMTGAQLLREDRGDLLHRRLDDFVNPEDHAAYHQMLEEMSRDCERQTCPLSLRRADGSTFHAQIDCVAALPTHSGTLAIAIIDLSERKVAEAEIASLAFYDSLTHLPNRRLLLDRILQASHSCHRTLKHGALLALDLDGFKLLNDTQGHDAGDRILQQAARRLTTCVREVDTVGRLGGDEFVVLIEDLSEDAARAATQATNIGEKVLAALRLPYFLGRQEYHSTGSMGISLFSDTRESVEAILKRADLALYQAKAVGGGVLQLFDPELEAASKARIILEAELRQGIEERQFVLHYQPQLGEDGQVFGVEALVRWQHPHRGLLLPAEFLPLAEEKGLVTSLGQVVLETACAQLAAWSHARETAHLSLAINISTHEFCHPNLVTRTLETIRRSGVDPRKLVFEVTESLMLRSVEENVAKMRTLRAHGVRFSLDDFGMGFSSLVYLKSLPLDQLKIDTAFVRDVLTDRSSAAIVRTIITLGKTLGLSVIAEGVETLEQKEFLAAQGCSAYQGNLFSKPVPAETLRLMDSSFRHRAAS